MGQLAYKNWSFSRKVLVPILLIMIALVAFTVMFMNHRMGQQIREQATLELLNSQRMFRQYMSVRLNDIEDIAQSIPTDSRIRAAAQLDDPKTLSGLVDDLLLEKRVSGITYLDPEGVPLITRGTGIPRNATLPDFTAYVPRLQAGGVEAWISPIDGLPFELGAAPIFIGPEYLGAVVVINSIDEVAALELSRLTGCEITFCVGEAIPITTWRSPRQRQAFATYMSTHGKQHPASTHSEVTPPVQNLSFDDEHFLGIHQQLTPTSDGMAAMLIASYEPQLRYLRRTRTTLLTIGLLGVVLAGGIAHAVIRRITRPLSTLQAQADAVGRGEFEHRVPSDSTDEIGQLATSFNHMASNLQESKKELETAHSRLIQGEKLSALGEFIAGVAHELNNPLTVMVGYSQLLAESEDGDHAREELTQISDAAERCQSVVQNLLSFARQRPPERIRVDVNELLEGTSRFMHYELHTSGIKLEMKLASDLAPIMGDPHQLQQVFLNLARNAQQAMESSNTPSRLSITSSNTGTNEVEVRIEDNGPGIPPQFIDKIFDPFFTSKKDGKGTGLGLSVSYGIIQEHGGLIHAESPPDQGATFVVTLPAMRSQQLEETAQTELPPSPTLDHVRRMLVVDDETGILEMIQNFLKPCEIEVETTTSAVHALERIREEEFDVILSDWKMPDMNGQTFFEQWKEHTQPSTATTFVFMTGDVLNSDLQTYLDSHGLSCLRKPFNRRVFMECIDQASAATAVAPVQPA